MNKALPETCQIQRSYREMWNLPVQRTILNSDGSRGSEGTMIHLTINLTMMGCRVAGI